MEVSNPRRVLAIGAPGSGILGVLQDLTGSAPALVDDSTAGLSHVWDLSTSYYSAKIPIWLDEIVDVAAWREEFTKPEAKEVVTALGAWVYCFRKPVTAEDLKAIEAVMKAIAEVIKTGCGYSWDGQCLAVATSQSTTPNLQKSFEDWEELCREHNFEFVDAEAKGRNEFGEPVGIRRLKEALETNDWEGEVEIDLDELGLNDSDDETAFKNSFAAEEAEINMELFGMKSAVHGGDDEDEELQVEEMERMALKLHAIRDTSSAMPEEERKRFAAKAVGDLLKNLK